MDGALTLPPGLAGYVAADQNRRANEMAQMQQVQGILGMRGLLMAQMQMNREMQKDAFLKEFLQSRMNPVARATANGQGPTLENAANLQAVNHGSGPAPFSTEDLTTAMLAGMDPRKLVAINQWASPDLKNEGGVFLHPRTGQPVATAPVIPQTNQQGYSTTKVYDPATNRFSIATTPGAEEAYRRQQQIAADVASGNELVTTPPTSPTEPPRQTTKAARIKEVTGTPSNVPVNNLGNLRPVGASIGFNAYATPEAGIAALDQDLAAKGHQGLNTITKIITKYAPPNENDTKGYIASVSKQLGIDPDQPLDMSNAAVRHQISAAIIRQEQGAKLFSAAPSNAAGMSPKQEAEVAAYKETAIKNADANAKIYADLNKASMVNPQKIAKFQRIGTLLGDFEGGKLSNAGLEFARLANSFGIKIDPKLPAKEASEALSKEVALELRSTGEGNGMPGQMSDADRDFLRSMAPQMASTANGRKMIIESRVKLWQREMKVAEMARQYKKKYGQLDEDFFSQLQAWGDRNPIFGKQ